MANGPEAAVLSYVRGIADRAGRAGDGQLLERFFRAGDQAAFAALVRRHGPLVFGVCRRVLADWHDAEDAFQATFLVLVRKGPSLDCRKPLGNWLYGVAYRTALKARATALRRRRREGPLVAEVASPPAPDSDRHLRALLDREVNRLPTRYRAAVVLCYLQGKTYAEAARQLGCPKGTLSIRLTRARAMLRRRLARRGLALGVAGPLLCEPGTAAVPEALAGATVRAGLDVAAGHASAVALPVAALAHGVVRAMAAGKLKVVVAVLVAVGVVAGGVRIVTISTGPTLVGEQLNPVSRATAESQRPPVKAGPQEPKPETFPVTVSGKAFDKAGKPVSGATVHLLSLNASLASAGPPGRDTVAATVSTDEHGEYEFIDIAFPMVRPRKHEPLVGMIDVFATAPGYGFTWASRRVFHTTPRPEGQAGGGSFHLNEPMVLNLTFPPAGRLRGRIVDEADKPVPGMEIELVSAERRQGVDFDRFRCLPAAISRAASDAEGRFGWDGLPLNATFRVWLKHPEFAHAELYATPSDAPAPVKHIPSTVWTGDIDLTFVRPGRVVTRAVAADTGTPLAGVVTSAWNSVRDLNVSASGKTDDDGKVSLRLPPGTYRLNARPHYDSRFVPTDRELTVGADPEQQAEVRVRLGGVVILEAVDADTGKPVPGVPFHVRDEQSDWRPVQNSPAAVMNPFTDAQGNLRVTDYPGKRSYRISNQAGEGTRKPFQTVPDPTDPAETEPGVKQVELQEGKTLTLRFKLRRPR
jgi:RNA polymerase sigma factor (sigma-70 family)